MLNIFTAPISYIMVDREINLKVDQLWVFLVMFWSNVHPQLACPFLQYVCCYIYCQKCLLDEGHELPGHSKSLHRMVRFGGVGFLPEISLNETVFGNHGIDYPWIINQCLDYLWSFFCSNAIFASIDTDKVTGLAQLHLGWAYCKCHQSKKSPDDHWMLETEPQFQSIAMIGYLGPEFVLSFSRFLQRQGWMLLHHLLACE